MLCKPSVLGVIIALLLVSYALDMYKSKQSIKQNLEVKQQMINIVKEYKEDNQKNILDIAKLTDFEWDKLYVVRPYERLNKFIEKNDLILNGKIETQIEVDESVCLLLFVGENKILSYIEYPRVEGDFSYEDDEISFVKEDSVFYIKLSENGIYFSRSNN